MYHLCAEYALCIGLGSPEKHKEQNVFIYILFTGIGSYSYGGYLKSTIVSRSDSEMRLTAVFFRFIPAPTP